MRDYHKKRNERELFVRELYGLGLSFSEITETTRWSKGTLVKDIIRFGGAKMFPDRPKKGDVFVAVIRRYAEIITVSKENRSELPKETNAVREALATWLRVDLILAILHGLEFTLEQLMVPVYSRERQAHARLLGAIFGVVVGDPCKAESLPFTATKSWWHNTLVAIHSGKEEIPQSRKHLGKMLVRRVLAERRAKIMPIWDESVFTHVNDMLETLTEREYKLICEHFGIGTKKATLEEIASELGLTRERIRQIEVKAIRKLRAQAEKRHLMIFGAPLNDTLQCEFVQQKPKKKEEEAAQQQTVAITSITDPTKLFQSVNEFELSVRLRGCLSRADIVLIGELVEWKPEELSRIKNLGRKSLNEINEVLASLGLTLGMKLSDELKVLLTLYKRGEYPFFRIF